jgi:hypothetical protein
MPGRPTSLIVFRATVIPSPSLPTRFSRGILQSFMMISPVSDPLSPILCSCLPAVKPWVPLSMTNALIPFGPSPVFATTRVRRFGGSS